MTPIQPGDHAPAIPSARLDRPTAVFFYKVTCPTCQLAAPVTDTFESAYPGHIVGVGQDPQDKLGQFADEFGVSFASVSEAPPYALSDVYGIRTVPTLFLVEDGVVSDTVEGWDRDGYNRVSARLAEATGRDYVPISEADDGLPAFKPG
jgi:thiol-disulfide isomerase/thioredoxin